MFQAFEAARRANEAVMQALLAALLYQHALDRVQRVPIFKPGHAPAKCKLSSTMPQTIPVYALMTCAPIVTICIRIGCSRCYAGRALIDIGRIAEVYAEKPLPMEPWLAAERWPTDPCHMRSYRVKRVKRAVSSFW